MTPAGWELAWRSRDTGLEVHHERMPDFVRQRVVSHQFVPGAVVYATDGDAVLFVGIDRPAVGRWFLELPRGEPEPEDPDQVATGLREVREETGWVADEARLMGTIWPDSGLLADAVGVVRATHLTRTDASAEFADQRWLSGADIDRQIASGNIRDGISLSAITLCRAAD